MNINIKKRLSKDDKKVFYSLEWGREKGQRIATGIFTFAKPSNQIEKNHNKEALAILEAKRSQLVLDRQATSSGIIPQHKFKSNFVDYYTEFAEKNKLQNNRHMEGSLTHFKKFIKADYLSPVDVTENLCERFRKYLLDKFNGGTPACYFARFKRVLRSATKEGYFRVSPSQDVAAKTNKNFKRKEHLEVPEYLQLLNTPCVHEEVREAFIFCCYTGLRWCDVKPLSWQDIGTDEIKFRIVQEKTTVEHTITLHEVAKKILDKRRKRLNDVGSGLVFMLPSQERALFRLDQWCGNAGITKHITWHSARLSFSILLQDAQVDVATVALLLGQTSSAYVLKTYKRYRLKDQTNTIAKLPASSTS